MRLPNLPTCGISLAKRSCPRSVERVFTLTTFKPFRSVGGAFSFGASSLSRSSRRCGLLVHVAGLERARRQGKVPGRPKRVFRRDEVVRLRDVEHMSWRAIAAALGIPVTTAVEAYPYGKGLAQRGFWRR